MRLSIFVSLMLVACAEVEDARLDHAQILAVRADPPHVAPGGTSRIDVLAGNDAGEVYVVSPDSVDAGALAAQRTADGWFVTASDTAGIAIVSVSLVIDGVAWRADKALVIAAPRTNPRVAAMQVDGAASSELVAAAGTKPELTAIGEGAEPLTYAWYSSVGDLTFYRQPTAVLDAAASAEGLLLLVVRDAAGGVGWQLLPARVE